MDKFEIDLRFHNSRPFINLKIPFRSEALIDTGASFMILNITTGLANKLAIRASEQTTNIYGLGNEPIPCYKYIIPYFVLGHIKYYYLMCFVPAVLLPKSPKIILPASLFDDKNYTIATLAKKLIIEYTSSESLYRQLRIEDSKGKLTSLSYKVNLEFKGDTKFEFKQFDKVIYSYTLYNLDIVSTFDFILEQLAAYKNLLRDDSIHIHIVYSDFKLISKYGIK